MFSAQRLNLFAWCVRLSRLLVSFRTHLKSMHFHFHSLRSRHWSWVRIWTLDPDSRPGSNSLWQRSVLCECSSYPCNAVCYYLQYTRTDGKSDRNLPNFFVFFFFCEPVLFSFLAAQEQTTANTRHRKHTHTCTLSLSLGGWLWRLWRRWLRWPLTPETETNDVHFLLPLYVQSLSLLLSSDSTSLVFFAMFGTLNVNINVLVRKRLSWNQFLIEWLIRSRLIRTTNNCK